jgi:sigma-E factor negative regulatory protein RseB
MQSHAFDGVVVVEWRDEEGRHREQVPVHQQDGRVEVGSGDHTVAGDASRVMINGQAWTTLGGGHGEDTTALTRGKYRVSHRAGPMIAGSPTTQYEATRAGRVVERVYVHENSGLVLRREVLDANGDVARSISFMRVQESAGDTPTSSTVPPEAGPRPVDDLDGPYQDPASAGDGFRLIGRWQHSDDLAQLYYSDGVLSVSVFEQPGHLDWDTLPAGGVDADVNGRAARRYALPVGEAWVFERGGVVYTCVGDASAEELAALADDVSQPDESRVERLAEMVVDPFRW